MPKKNQKVDSREYKNKRAFFDKLLTIYGRKPVLEVLSDKRVQVYRLHLSDSNKSSGIINEITDIAKKRNIEIVHHSKKELSRISKNSKQDQGVAADVLPEKYETAEEFLGKRKGPYSLLALDGITNPQNLGMIIRSVCAGYIDGVVIPSSGGTQISPLVIKASVGTVFRCPIIKCGKLKDALTLFKKEGAEICTLSSHAKESLFSYKPKGAAIYVLGNETDGVSDAVGKISDRKLMIPMSNNVESLNVAVTASLIAFMGAGKA